MLLVAGAVALYVLSPRLVRYLSVAPAVLRLDWRWLGLMVMTGATSLIALALLVRLLLTGVRSWVDVLLVQLTANAAALAMPGGAAYGAGVSGRLLVRSGAKSGDAAAALGASALLSTLTIAALAPIAGGLAILHTDLPSPLAMAVLLGAALAAAIVVAAVLLLATDGPLRAWAWVAHRLDVVFLRRVHHPLDISLTDLRRDRDDLRARLGRRWPGAIGLAAANWLLDFATLVAALAAVGADLALGVALLAFVVSAVLRMVPITPGGLGLVEGGLTSVLTLTGLPALTALVAALAYRAVTLWLPLPAGAVAYAVHRHRYPVR